MIDPATVQKIKDTADIVDVVSDYVHLVRRGANYMGLCPFHNERTPSFSVNKSRNFCYCFSCHKGGSPVNFIMEKEGISYHDALLQLAAKYGIEVEERELSDEEREAQSRREGMFVANEWAKNYFIENLYDTGEGREIGISYLYGRKVTPEAIKAFQLGYSLDKGADFTQAALKKGFSLDVLKAIGLTGTSKEGHDYDRFRGRVMFPVLNSAGKTVAFGGRDLKGSPAKYINSPESQIYNKSKELYGIFQAKGEMVRQDKCYLVEGYLDVIGMWQSGIKNTVASSGTALTDGQIALIHRFTQNVTLIYDGDSAGMKASIRGIDMLLSHNLNVKAVKLPDGEDPDSISSKLTPEELKDFLLKNETDVIRFKINVLLADANNDPQKKWLVVRSIVESLAHISDKIKRDIYIQECSNLLEIKESVLSREIAKARVNVIEQEKLKRRTQEIERDFPLPSPYPVEEERIVVEKTTAFYQDSPLYFLEEKLLKDCLKYGFFIISDFNDNAEEIKTILDFINEELSIDGITISHPEYLRIFNELSNLLPLFKKDVIEFRKNLEKIINQKRNEGFEEIATKSLSINEIKKEEDNLESRLDNFARAQTDEFCKNYIIDKFGSHEDDLIRKITNDSVVEKHRLSSFFTKNKDPEDSRRKVIDLVLSSLNILKNGIIDEELKKLMNELKNLDSGNTDKEKELHQRIGMILQLRSRMAKDIGDRIIDPNSVVTKRNN
ncbi:MAG: DNA primase [Muribaculaceae bacterium]|nr:DNA primase [Muribaculaceae bacterium]